MRWEWDDSGDNRVAELWHLRAQLAEGRKVVYTKWFRGRATVFSKKLFTALLADQGLAGANLGLSGDSRRILEVLEADSPLSTRQVKEFSELRGKFNESTYERAMKTLWNRQLIVGCGEVDDGAFPSLAVGATRLIFEDLWEEASALSKKEASETIHSLVSPDSAFHKYLEKIKK